MLRLALTVLLAVAACSWSAREAAAQAFGGGGMSSGGGGGGVGASGGSSFGGGSNAFSSAGGAFGGSATAGFTLNNPFGTGNNAGGAYGQSNLVGVSAGGMYGGTPSGTNSTSRNGTGSYGTQSNGSRSSTSSNQSRRGNTSNARRGRSSQQPANAKTSSKEQQPWFEPRVEVGFEVKSPATSVVQTRVSAPFHGTAALSSRFTGVQVAVEGETAILRGTVQSNDDRDMAERVALLDPSISSVRNEIAVRPQANAAAKP